MNDFGKISVIVTVYNTEKYLKKCLNSITTQTYPNLEIILVDDGSTDRCPAICDEYAEHDIRVKAIHKANGGVSDARNTGIKNATAPIISFVDSDDFLHPKYYEIMAKTMKYTDADVVACDYEIIEPAFKMIPEVDNVPEIVAMSETESKDPYYIYDKRSRFIVPWNKLYDRSLFNDVEYPVGKIYEDEATTFKIMYKAKKIVYVKEQLCYHVERPDALTMQPFSENNFMMLDALESKMEFYRSHNQIHLYNLVYMTYKQTLLKYMKEMETANIDKKLLAPYQKHFRELTKVVSKEKLLSPKKKMLNMLFSYAPDVYEKVRRIAKD